MKKTIRRNPDFELLADENGRRLINRKTNHDYAVNEATELILSLANGEYNAHTIALAVQDIYGSGTEQVFASVLGAIDRLIKLGALWVGDTHEIAAASEFDVVISTSNNYYCVWQAMLFHYSCVKHLGVAATVLVHTDQADLIPEFRLLESFGCRVQHAPDYPRLMGFGNLSCNTLGTLKCVESDADYIMLCDPDMLFVNSIDFSAVKPAGNEITFDRIYYLYVDGSREHLEEPAKKLGIDLARYEASPVSGGVPHIIAKSLVDRLADEWIYCMQQFNADELYISSMWSLVFAAERLKIAPKMTELCMLNSDGDEPGKVPLSTTDKFCMVHYLYGEKDQKFTKRHFRNKQEFNSVWSSTAPSGTINQLVCDHLNEAGAYYGLLEFDAQRLR